MYKEGNILNYSGGSRKTSALFNTKKEDGMQKHPLEDLIEPVVSGLGYELVRVMTIGQTLQIMIDRMDGSNIIVDDCAKVSRALSAVFDEKDPIEDKYTLEVSSPGLDRPLTKPSHFERFLDLEAKVETNVAVEERKRFKGKIVRAEASNITINMEGVEYVIPFENITKAKLVLNDELLSLASEEQLEEE